MALLLHDRVSLFTFETLLWSFMRLFLINLSRPPHTLHKTYRKKRINQMTMTNLTTNDEFPEWPSGQFLSTTSRKRINLMRVLHV